METIDKQQRQMKRHKDMRLQSIYSRALLTRKIMLPMKTIGKNLDFVIEECVRNNYEGKCVVEGYVQQNSIKIIRYSSGTIERGCYVVFEVVFECNICFPVEGMLVPCSVKNVVKAGIRAESASDIPSPVVVFIAKDHHHNNHYFNSVQVGDTILVRVIGQRFELNDKYISIIGELVRDKETFPTKQPIVNKPKLVIEE